MNKNRMLIGESDYKSLIKDESYYIDKTLLIKDVLDNTSMVAIITRPRRFGKTLNMTMMRYFFDITMDTKELFKDKKIMQEDEYYTSKLNSVPVIYITLKDLMSRSYESMIRSLKMAIKDAYSDHRYLLESDKIYEDEKERIKDILLERAEEDELKFSVKELSRFLSRQYGKDVLILIDEYDVPIQYAYLNGYYEEAIAFLKEFFGATFKDNKFMKKTVLTGVSRVAKESIFSGANNFKVYTVLDNDFSDKFGITKEEMEQVIKDFEIEENKEELKRWYDGYKMGNTENIYNPWSIINFVSDKKLQPYWVNTSSNDLIKLVLERSETIKEKIERLLKGEEIEVPINQETVIVGIENNEDNIWGLMLGTGYLKITDQIDERRYKVKIPNYEIKYLFEDIIEKWFLNKVIGNDLRSILKDLVTLNLVEFEKKFKELVIQMFSYMDVGEKTAENFYHAFVLGMLVGLKDTYYVNSNRESGLGRYDIMLEPKDKNGNSFIMEFKVYEKDLEKTIEDTIENAIKQIEEKKYEENIKERGFNNITKMVFAFNGKNMKMKIV